MNNVILRAISLTLLASVAACNGSDNKSTTPPVTTGDDASIFANLNAQIAGLDADAKAKQTTIDAQNQRIEALAQAQADAKALAAAEEAAKAQAARSDADQQAALVKRIGELEQKLAAGPAISPEVEARLSSLKDLIDTLADAPKFDPATLALLEGQIAGLQTELAKMAKSESVTALEQSLGTLKTTLADPAKLTSLGTDMDKVKLDLEVLTTLTKDLDPETLAELKATLASLRTDIDGKMSIDPATIKSISERLAEVEQALAALPLAVAADDSPAARALVRLLPNHFSQVAFVRIEKLAGAQDSYRIFGNEGAITIEATSPATFLTGLGEYLEQVAHVSIGWPGDSLDKLAAKLPAPSTEIKRTANVKDRFALNDTDDSYADAYKTWPEWERKIDLLAMHGMNEVFIPVGTEEVYRETFKQFGYSDEEIRAWIPAPAHQPWWLLQNMAEEHGPMSVELYQRRVEIGQKITKRLVELGMTPVLPGYFGTVPTKFNVAAKLKCPVSAK